MASHKDGRHDAIELAHELGLSDRTVRAWLRRAFPRSPAERYQRWVLSEAIVRAARTDGGLAKGYERGNVAAIRYDHGAVPAADELVADLHRFLELLGALYATPGAPTPVGATKPTVSRPPLSNIPAFIQWVRAQYGESLVPSRLKFENEARELLDAHAGHMSAAQAATLGELFNSGEWGGVLYHNRFSPAFAGGAMNKVVDPIDEFNRWTERLWRAPIDDALAATDTILKDTSAFPGAGRSFPTMLLYLRDPERFAIWLQITHRGLTELGLLTVANERKAGIARYQQYASAALTFADHYGLAPQEVDAILAEAARAGADEKTVVADEAASLNQGADAADAVTPVTGEYALSDVAAATFLPLEDLARYSSASECAT